MPSIRKEHRGSRCKVRLCGRKKWIEGYAIREFRVTKAAAKRRARTLGLPPRRVPSGTWFLVVTGAGWFTVPAKQVRH